MNDNSKIINGNNNKSYSADDYVQVLKIKTPNLITGYPFNVKNITRTLRKIDLVYHNSAYQEKTQVKTGGGGNKIIVFCI